MGNLRRIDLKKILAETGISTLVETGTGQGESIECALPFGFSSIYTCEGEKSLFECAQKKFKSFPSVHLNHDKSVSFLQQFIPTGKTLYFLDAHFWGGADFEKCSREAVTQHKDSFPLCDELLILLEKEHIKDSVIIIDDARLYYDDNFQSGKCPPELMNRKDLPRLKNILGVFSKVHHMNIDAILHDEGYIIISPKDNAFSLAWIMVMEKDESIPGQLETGINGITGISISRRMRDARFATTYLRGNCLDVGGGKDSLGLYKQFFPLLNNVFCYDLEHGDAQFLDNVPDATFDCLYSSHCLEHLDDPAIGLKNWIRVVKPGGFLVVTVPDEDLYEQGIWPSRYALHHHKKSFTIQKRKSWSPVSVNILPLLVSFCEAITIHKVELVDTGYHHNLGRVIDQTQLPSGECTIELILQKI